MVIGYILFYLSNLTLFSTSCKTENNVNSSKNDGGGEIVLKLQKNVMIHLV